MNPVQAKWDEIYRTTQSSPTAAEVLTGNSHLLPQQGRALDLACGLGGNALFLADRGLNVDAWDISSVALNYLQTQARQKGLAATIRHGEITSEALAENSYDVIVISRFLDRTLGNAIMGALTDKGLLYYQTFTRNKLNRTGPNKPEYLLDSNELLKLFSPLTLVFYQEFALIGDLRHGNRDEVCYIGQKVTPVTL
jgi:tellurite methyltransferase